MPEELLAFVVLYGILSVVIFIHECGHYLGGRAVGLHATAVVTGVGPIIWEHTDRRGTQWAVRTIMIGGYCTFDGDQEKATQPYQRLIMVLAGPLANYIMVYIPLVLLAILAMFLPIPSKTGGELQVGELLWMPIYFSFEMVGSLAKDLFTGVFFIRTMETGNMVGVTEMMAEDSMGLPAMAILLFFGLNLVAGAFNLLVPLLPLDGGHVVLELLRLAKVKETWLARYKTINTALGITLVLVLLATTMLADLWALVR